MDVICERCGKMIKKRYEIQIKDYDKLPNSVYEMEAWACRQCKNWVKYGMDGQDK